MRRTLMASLCAGVLLIGAVGCSDDDGPTTLAQGEDVELVGDDGLAGQTLSISAEEEDGEVTGELRITENVIGVECAETDADGVVILGGEAMSGGDFEGLLALIIREGDPDSVSLYGNDAGARSCRELLETIPEDVLTDRSHFVDVEADEDIETA